MDDWAGVVVTGHLDPGDPADLSAATTLGRSGAPSKWPIFGLVVRPYKRRGSDREHLFGRWDNPVVVV